MNDEQLFGILKEMIDDIKSEVKDVASDVKDLARDVKDLSVQVKDTNGELTRIRTELKDHIEEELTALKEINEERKEKKVIWRFFKENWFVISAVAGTCFIILKAFAASGFLKAILVALGLIIL